MSLCSIKPWQKFPGCSSNSYILMSNMLGPLQGNKSWKLKHYFDNANTTYKDVKSVTSWGGTQSNSMLAIAQLCKTNNWKFDYYCSNKVAPVGGNWEHALSLGMNAHSIEAFCTSGSSDRLVIPQGGSVVEAELGIREVAEGIIRWNKFENLNVIVPSGTGTTSFYLAKHLFPRGVQVYTVPCVGNENYLYEQIYNNLGESKENVDRVMRVIPSVHGHKFAYPYEEYYRFWKDIHKETNVELDLIYAPKTLLSVLPILKDLNEVWLYVHTGGTLGNQSQIERYKRKYKL